MNDSPRAAARAVAPLLLSALAACSGPATPAESTPRPASGPAVEDAPNAGTESAAAPSPTAEGSPSANAVAPSPTTSEPEERERVEALAPSPEEPPGAAVAAPIDPNAPLCARYRAMRTGPNAHAKLPIPCDEVDQLVYYSRGSDGTCGPTALLRVTARGDVKLERVPPGLSGDRCPSSTEQNRRIEAKRAKAIIAACCAELNASAWRPGAGCEGSTRRFHFMSGDVALFGTTALPCAGAMGESEARMLDLISSFK